MKQQPGNKRTPFSFSALKRSAGILLHITSLPSAFGIGDFGPGAKAFADFLHRSNQTFWQLLPLNPTSIGQGNSPYSASSSMAGNVLLISPELLVEDGLLSQADIEPYKMQSQGEVDFEKAEKIKYALLEKAYINFCKNLSAFERDFKAFCRQESYWLDDFALFTVIKKEHGGKQWSEWEDVYKQRGEKALQQFTKAHKEDIDKTKWQQFVFSKQWDELKEYCNNINIQLFGDMPYYVASDSADVWSQQDIFSINKEGKQQFVAGTPPDDFNPDGQLWGMPVFKWSVLQQRNYDWWISRLKKNLALFDLLRLDHFRAFTAYWQVKAGADTALKGEWIPAPGNEFFTVLRKEFGELPFVAEDLGHIDAPVYKLRDAFELPGMNVLQFAFEEDMPKSVHIPHHHIQRGVVYTGTHDTNTTLGWYKTLPKQTRKNLIRYTGTRITQKNVCDLLCRAVYASVSKLAVLPLQDVLGLDEEARMNTPSGGERNWTWRMMPEHINRNIEKKLNEWCEVYDRK